MSDPAERLRRALILVPYLAQHRGARIDDVAKALEIDRATLLEDLELLPLIGRPPFTPADYIDLTMENDRVTLSLDQRLSRPPPFTASEVAALAAAAAALEPEREGNDALARALAKLDAAVPASARAQYLALTERVTAGGDEALGDLLRPLTEAVVRRREVVVEYLSPASERPQRRTVQPWRVLSHRGHWYLLAKDKTKQAERLFRVDRITRLTPTEARFERPAQLPQPGEELLPRKRKAEAAPVLRFSARVAALALERFGQEAHREKDGRVRVELSGATAEWLVSLVLTHAGDVEVLAPESLRQQVHEAVTRAQAAYAD